MLVGLIVFMGAEAQSEVWHALFVNGNFPLRKGEGRISYLRDF